MGEIDFTGRRRRNTARWERVPETLSFIQLPVANAMVHIEGCRCTLRRTGEYIAVPKPERHDEMCCYCQGDLGLETFLQMMR